MIQGPSTSDDLSLSLSSSSSVTNSLWVNEGTNDMNLLGDHDEDLPPAAAEEKNNNNVNVDTNIIIGKDADDDNASSISESSFNGYAALANLDEEEWEDNMMKSGGSKSCGIRERSGINTKICSSTMPISTVDSACQRSILTTSLITFGTA
jgi:hypothetical protein